MTTTEESVDDIDVLERVLESRAEEMHTALPGKVVRYEPGGEDGRQKADVQPVIRRLVGSEKGVTRERMPVLRSVPVVHPRWGSWYIHAPLAPGDKVLIVCLERDASQWLQSGEESDPVDRRGHHLSHAVCIPGLFPNAERLPQQPSDELVIGKDGGPKVRIRDDGEVHVEGSKDLALAGNLDTHLSNIAKSLDEIRVSISGPGSTDPNYGTAAKTALDTSSPIPTKKTKGS